MTRCTPRLLILAACLMASITAHARIGESSATIERRITNGQRGLVLDDDIASFYLDLAPFKGAMLHTNDKNEWVPYSDLNMTAKVYYKTIGNERAFSSKLIGKNGQPLQSPDGWLLYVVYYKDRSVLEVYTRSGGINQAETNGILSLNQGSANWVNEKLPEEKYPNKDYKPLLPHNLYRSDIELLANQSGNHLMIFMLDTDAILAKVKKDRETKAAPDSLSGF